MIEVERLIGAGPLDDIDFEALERAGRDAALGILGRMVAHRLVLAQTHMALRRR